MQCNDVLIYLIRKENSTVKSKLFYLLLLFVLPAYISNGAISIDSYAGHAVYPPTSKPVAVKKKTWKQKFVNWVLKKKIQNYLKKKKFASKGDRANTALILSIIAMAGLMVPFVNLLSLPLAIIALIMGYNARKADPESRDARLAIILSWITIGLAVVSIGFVILLFSLFWV
jgi:hypothetical protein